MNGSRDGAQVLPQGSTCAPFRFWPVTLVAA